MIEHPRARCNITLNEFEYIQGKRAILRGLQIEKKYYQELDDLDSARECQLEWRDEFNEMCEFKEALIRSDEYHKKRLSR